MSELFIASFSLEMYSTYSC